MSPIYLLICKLKKCKCMDFICSRVLDTLQSGLVGARERKGEMKEKERVNNWIPTLVLLSYFCLSSSNVTGFCIQVVVVYILHSWQKSSLHFYFALACPNAATSLHSEVFYVYFIIPFPAFQTVWDHKCTCSRKEGNETARRKNGAQEWEISRKLGNKTHRKKSSTLT